MSGGTKGTRGNTGTLTVYYTIINQTNLRQQNGNKYDFNIIICLNFDEKNMGTWEQETGSGTSGMRNNSAGDL